MPLRTGDVLALKCLEGTAYILYLGRHARMGDTVWVLPYVLREPPESLCSHVASEGYVAFYPANTTLRRKLVSRVAYCPEAVRPLPVRERLPSIVDRDGVVRTWLIVSAEGTYATQQLSSLENELPIGGIWSHGLLVHRIDTGWRPEHGVGDPPGVTDQSTRPSD